MSNLLFNLTFLKNSRAPLNFIEQLDKFIYITSDNISGIKHLETAMQPSFPIGFELISNISILQSLRLFLR